MTPAMITPKRIGLGTVQFGLDYGISNCGGQTPLEEARKIVNLAAEAGIRVIDTAAVYGNSEDVLGRILPKDHQFHIVTKTEPLHSSEITVGQADSVRERFLRSLEALSVDRVYGLMVHHVDDLMVPGGDRLFDVLTDLRRQELVERIGASIYTGEQVDHLLDSYPCDLIQLPLNVFDQRLIRGGQLARLHARGVEIHARSVFLQGLLLMPPADIPAYFNRVRSHIEQYHQDLDERQVTPQAAALAYIAGQSEVDCMILGVNDEAQLRANLDALEAATGIDFDAYAIEDETIVNPAVWETV